MSFTTQKIFLSNLGLLPTEINGDVEEILEKKVKRLLIGQCSSGGVVHELLNDFEILDSGNISFDSTGVVRFKVSITANVFSPKVGDTIKGTVKNTYTGGYSVTIKNLNYHDNVELFVNTKISSKKPGDDTKIKITKITHARGKISMIAGK